MHPIPRHVSPPHTNTHPSPAIHAYSPVDRITHACENSTFHFAGGNHCQNHLNIEGNFDWHPENVLTNTLETEQKKFYLLF